MPSIPLARPDLSEKEAEYARLAVRSSWISSTGSFVDRFERDFARLCQSRTAVSICNGTAAIHLAMLALGVGPGDEVLVPSLTYVATANAVRYVGAEPVFVDVDPGSWCIDPALLEQRVSSRTKGIIPVHLYGHPADMDAISELAERRGLWVVEDAAEAHLARYRGVPVGGLSSMGVFSFYGNKILTSGEGGCLTISDSDLEQRVRLYRNQGMDPERRYFFPVVGYNYRLTNVACAILCAQLERATMMLDRRRQIFALYREALSSVSGIGFQPVADWAEPSPWLYSITVEGEAYGRSRDELMAWLAESGIETRPFFIPVHRLPPYANGSRSRRQLLPVTDRLAATGLNLPTSSTMRDEDVGRVVEVIAKGRR